MSFLTPLYFLGAMAVAAPILFHLIQRRPKGETRFSSLMFLSPSPPRLTRRRRLDNILLLLLRALALTLLAIAFARPFLRSTSQLDFSSVARRTVILVDTSASMKRDGVWPAAVAQIKKVCDESSIADRLALMTFDKDPETVIGFDAVGPSKTSQTRELIKRQAPSLEPTWHETDLGAALIAACNLLQDAASDDGALETPPQIVLVTDGQQGTNIKALDSFDWPQGTPVDVRIVPSDEGNAFAQMMIVEDADTSSDVVVRIVNVDVKSTDQFGLEWVDENDQVELKRTVQVPLGQSRVVRFPREHMTTRLVLRGDHEQFDNTLFFATPTAMARQILAVGSESNVAASSKGLFYFLDRIDLSTRFRDVTVERAGGSSSGGLAAISTTLTPLVVAGEELKIQDAEILHAYVKAGGNVLGVFSKTRYEEAEIAAWRTLTGLDLLSVSEADVNEYAMLSNIDFDHPFFAPFAESQFNDFTKVRFWAFRHLSPAHEQAWRVLARFDNSSPALMERSIGDGKVWILAAGWHPDDSQLALSSKFVPLIASMFDASDSMRHTSESFQVGDSVTLDFALGTVEIENPAYELTDPNGQTLQTDSNRFVPQGPGVYAVQRKDQVASFAVNMSRQESSTPMMDLSKLEQRGVRLGDRQSAAEIKEYQRQMKDVELESNQQIWRILIFGTLFVLGIETWLAGSQAKTNLSGYDE